MTVINKTVILKRSEIPKIKLNDFELMLALGGYDLVIE